MDWRVSLVALALQCRGNDFPARLNPILADVYEKRYEACMHDPKCFLGDLIINTQSKYTAYDK